MAFYKKRIVRPDTPQDVAERISYRNACEKARAERKAKFPVLTTQNFEEAAAFQNQRIADAKLR